jgi:hypothetical protein
MRVSSGILVAALAATGAHAKMVTAGTDKSWGKPGVSIDRYRAEGLACAQEAAASDLAKTGPARALVIASRLLENDPTPGPIATATPQSGGAAAVDAIPSTSSAGIVANIGPQRQILKAGDIMKAKLEQCLTQLGYVKFKLTGEQRRRLRSLREGSDERRAYLYSLASDPNVLARQAVR